MGWRTVEVQLNSMYVVASKGFQKLTCHFFIIIVVIFVVLYYCFNVNVCLYAIIINVKMFFWLNQWKLCVSMVHIGDCLRAVWDMKLLFPPHSRLSGVDMRGTAALGHWRTDRKSVV